MKKLAILGASGSIGRQTLDLLKNNKIEYELIGVSIGKNIEVLQEKIIKLNMNLLELVLEKILRFCKKY